MNPDTTLRHMATWNATAALRGSPDLILILVMDGPANSQRRRWPQSYLSFIPPSLFRWHIDRV
jgi:hypothetical protein